MRVAIISDIHANLPALLSIGELVREADQVICLGDLVGYYCQVNEVIDFVRHLKAQCVLGNHDHFLLAGCAENVPEAVKFGVAFAARSITDDNRAWLAGLPSVWGGRLDGCSVLAVHGSPWSPINDYLYHDSPKLPALREFDFDVIAFGQTHRPLCDQTRRPWLINPGSIGQSRQAACVASFALWDTKKSETQLVERPYDATPVIEMARRNGAGDWIMKHLKK